MDVMCGKRVIRVLMSSVEGARDTCCDEPGGEQGGGRLHRSDSDMTALRLTVRR